MNDNSDDAFCSNVKEILTHPISPSKQKIPFYSHAVQAGFPNVADEHIDKLLDLNDLLIKHPAATFYVRVSGDSMIDAGIYSGDILIVDRSYTPRHNDIVLALVGNEYTIKRLYLNGEDIRLCPENKHYKPIVLNDSHELIIWGVATGVVRQIKK